MKSFCSRLAALQTPYVPGEQPKRKNLIKLNTNESPYPAAPEVLHAVQQEIEDNHFQLYPDPEAEALCMAIARRHGVRKDQVFVGNGSDEVLALSFMAFFDPDAPILFPDITYSFYPVYASLFQIPYRTVPLDENFCIRAQEYANAQGGVIFANPNAPTSIELPLESVIKILKSNPERVVIVDEAYAEFGHESALSLVDCYENLLVVRTFSKSHSMAGMRLGFAIGQPHLIRTLNTIKNCFNSYPIDRIAQRAGIAAMQAQEYYQQAVENIKNTRTWTKEQLEMRGFTLPDSSTNFVFAKHKQADASMLFAQLRERNILVRHFNAPRIDQHLRITIGLPGEMKALFDALDDILGLKA